MPGFSDENLQIYDEQDPTRQAEFRVIGGGPGRYIYGLPNEGDNPPAINNIALTTTGNGFVTTQIMFDGLEIPLEFSYQGGNNPGLTVTAHPGQVNQLFGVYQSILTGTGKFVINENANIPDNAFTLCDNSDITKRATLQLSGISTATTRIYTLLNANVILAGSASTMTDGGVVVGTTGGLLDTPAGLTFAADLLTAPSIKVGSAGGYTSSDGSPGVTGSFTTGTLTIKDGIITNIA